MLDKHTFPFSVVAAKSLAAASTELESSIANVVVHASCYDPVRQPCLPIQHLRPRPTYRLLKLLQELMCLLFLCAV